MAHPLVKDPGGIRLGIIGMTPGNGHPYSWSAIINNYDVQAMETECPYPGITAYMGKENREQVGIPGVRVTHVLCDDRADAERVARVSRIDGICNTPAEMAAQVDAVVIATDIGHEHVKRAWPFVEAGLPVFIDKPLCDNRADLDVFSRWVKDGAKILSSSSMRYCKEFRPYHRRTAELGELRHIFMPMAKSWETYGIHALEAVYPILGPGFVSVRNTGDAAHNMVHIRHRSGCEVTIACIADMIYGGPMVLGGTAGHKVLTAGDTYQAFRDQLLSFVDYLRTGVPPFEFAETQELMRLVIGGIESRNQDHREVMI
jgi:predicted dehydrogenase